MLLIAIVYLAGGSVLALARAAFIKAGKGGDRT